MVLKKPEQPAAEAAGDDRVNHLSDDERAMRVTAQHAENYADLWTYAYVHASKRIRERSAALTPEYHTAGIINNETAARIADAVMDEWRITQRRLLNDGSVTAAMSRMRRGE